MRRQRLLHLVELLLGKEGNEPAVAEGFVSRNSFFWVHFEAALHEVEVSQLVLGKPLLKLGLSKIWSKLQVLEENHGLS